MCTFFCFAKNKNIKLGKSYLIMIGKRRQKVISFYQPRVCQQKWLRMGFKPMPTPVRGMLWNQGHGSPKTQGWTAQPSQLCVNSSMLAYKNANVFITTICVIFDWHLCKLSTTGLVINAIKHKIFLEELRVSHY